MALNRLSALRGGGFALPVARMGSPPLLHASDFLGAAEGVAVAVLAQPAALAGGLAGTPAIRLGTVLLPIGGAPVGQEQPTATKALASAWRAAHRERDARNRRAERKPKKTPPKKTDGEEGRRALGGSARRKRRRRKRKFRPPVFPHFHSAAHTRIQDCRIVDRRGTNSRRHG